MDYSDLYAVKCFEWSSEIACNQYEQTLSDYNTVVYKYIKLIKNSLLQLTISFIQKYENTSSDLNSIFFSLDYSKLLIV